MIRRVQASINLDALLANFHIAKAHAGHSKIATVIKANAYGHGLIPVAQALSSSADILAVTDVIEAKTLVEAGINNPILILQGIICRDDVKLICEHNFQLVIHSLEQLTLLEEEIANIQLSQPLTFWLKLESGMGRLGISPEKYCQAYQKLKKASYCKDVIMMTHLANSSLPDSPLNDQQLSVFRETEEMLCNSESDTTVSTSIPASSGLINISATKSDWARPGLMLYGSSPFLYHHKPLRREALKLSAVMTLQARVIDIQHLRAGANVGYCSQFICPQDMSIAIISIGYADGYPSNAPNGTPVLINNNRCGTVGRVSMDMIAVDLSNCPNAKVGDLATLWGEDLSLDEIAASTGILSYNLTCSVASRVSVIHG